MSRPARPRKHGFYPHKKRGPKKLSSPSGEAHGRGQKKRDATFFTDEQGRVRKIPLTKAAAQKLHEQRSTRSRTTDERLKAELAESPARWSKRMNRSDLKGIDYPKTEEAKRKPSGKRKASSKKRKEPSKSLAQRIHARRSKKAQAVDESKKAPIVKDVEEWKVKKNRLDMKNVDYPKKAKGKAEAKKTKKQPSKPEPVVKEVKPSKPERKKRARKAKRKAKPIKVSKRQVKEDMIYIEIKHLRDACDKFGVDPQEIDNTLSYSENKKHIHEMARKRGITEQEFSGEKEAMKQWKGQKTHYFDYMANQLEEAGFNVQRPDMY
jgi:hypothetical protein